MFSWPVMTCPQPSQRGPSFPFPSPPFVVVSLMV
jgi:hypothetical protein